MKDSLDKIKETYEHTECDQNYEPPADSLDDSDVEIQKLLDDTINDNYCDYPDDIDEDEDEDGGLDDEEFEDGLDDFDMDGHNAWLSGMYAATSDVIPESGNAAEPKEVNKMHVLALATDELNCVLEALEASYHETDDNIDAVIDMLHKLKYKPIAESYVFINAYETKQVYGGPEEGGWWYYVTSCLDSVGRSISTECDYDEVYDMFNNMCESFDVPNIIMKNDFVEQLVDGCNPSCFTHIGRYDSVSVWVENMPAEQHNTERQHYE